MKLNNKGFSMIELLAAVTILGILSILAIGSVQKLLEKSEKEFYIEQENGLVMAAESYYQGNTNELPKSIGHTKKVYLETLVDSKYIGDVKTKSKKNCNMQQSYVEIVKYTQKDYKYIVHLDCGDEYKTPPVSGKESPKVTIAMPNPDKEKDVKNIEITANLKGNNDGTKNLISYNYVIYAAPTTDPTNFKEVKNSGSVAIRSKEKTIKINVDKFLPAVIKVEVTAINKDGQKTTETSEPKTYKDIISPLCNTAGDPVWANVPSKTIKMICNNEKDNDGNGAGCARPYFTQVYTEEAHIGQMEIKDKAGNISNCPVNVYIDRNHPILTVTVKKTDGTTIKTLNAQGTTQSYTTGWQKDGVEISYSVSDTLELASLTIEKTGPTATDTTPSYKSPTTINLEGEKTKTGIIDTLNSVSFDGHNKYRITLTDIAGKKSYVTLHIKSDMSKPIVNMKSYDRKSDGSNGNMINEVTANNSNGTVTLEPSKWFNNTVAGVNLGITASDATSGIEKGRFDWNASGTTSFVSNPTWADGNDRDIKDGSDTSNFTGDGYRQGTYTVTDAAGNTSTIKVKLKIDKTSPTLNMKAYNRKDDGTNGTKKDEATANNTNKTVTLAPSNWFNSSVAGVNLGITADDNVSGVSSGTMYYDDTGATSFSDSRSLPNGGSRNISDGADTSNFTGNGYRHATYKIKDAAGNEATIKMRFKIDLTKPTVSVENSSDGNWTKNNVTLTVNHTDNLTGINKLEYSYDNSSWNAWSMDSATKTDGLWEAERNATVYIKATDGAGNSTTKNTKVKIDKSGPSLTIENSSGGSWTNSNVTITAKHSDSGSGMDKLAYSYDQSSWNSWSMDSATKTDGLWEAERNATLYVRAKDAVGNTTIKSTTIKIDKTDPAKPSSLSNSSGGKCTTSNITVTAKSSDADSGIKKWQYKFGSGDWNNESDGANFSVTLTANRDATMYIRVVDNAGNVSSSVSTTVIKKKTCHAKKCGYYGSKVDAVAYTNCHCGASSHSKGYPHFCIEDDGDICVRYNNGDLSKYPVCKDRSPSFTYYCPNSDPKDLGATYLS